MSNEYWEMAKHFARMGYDKTEREQSLRYYEKYEKLNKQTFLVLGIAVVSTIILLLVTLFIISAAAYFMLLMPGAMLIISNRLATKANTAYSEFRKTWQNMLHKELEKILDQLGKEGDHLL